MTHSKWQCTAHPMLKNWKNWAQMYPNKGASDRRGWRIAPFQAKFSDQVVSLLHSCCFIWTYPAANKPWIACHVMVFLSFWIQTELKFAIHGKIAPGARGDLTDWIWAKLGPLGINLLNICLDISFTCQCDLHIEKEEDIPDECKKFNL